MSPVFLDPLAPRPYGVQVSGASRTGRFTLSQEGEIGKSFEIIRAPPL